MKVYIVQPVEQNKEEDEVWGYIYSNEAPLAVFPTYYKAFEFCINDRCPDWEIEPSDLYAQIDPEDSSLHYIYEKGNEKNFFEPIMWAVIIEREMGV